MAAPSIYASGTVNIAGSTQLCGAYTSGHCDWATWVPDSNMIVFVGHTSVDPSTGLSR